jgi:uncharacterized protein involved in exopolysaccharide biosynthesis
VTSELDPEIEAILRQLFEEIVTQCLKQLINEVKSLEQRIAQLKSQ